MRLGCPTAECDARSQRNIAPTHEQPQRTLGERQHGAPDVHHWEKERLAVTAVLLPRPEPFPPHRSRRQQSSVRSRSTRQRSCARSTHSARTPHSRSKKIKCRRLARMAHKSLEAGSTPLCRSGIFHTRERLQ